MQQPWYATREQVKRALDSAETARNNAQIDRAIASASRSIESQMHRRFYPFDGTKYFGFRPWADGNSSWRLWLNEHDLISVDTLLVGGDTITDYFLEPANDGPPYRSIEMDLSSNSVFASGETWQRAVAITGTWGYWYEFEIVGELADDLTAVASDTATVTWTDPSKVGVGTILSLSGERMIITEMSFVDSTQNTGGTLAASAADVTITVSNSAGFYVGEVIRVDSERMLIVDIGTTTTIVVKRAWDGSVLATHSTSADIYGRTGIEVLRAQLGTVIAGHPAPDAVQRWVVPAGINDLCVAEALVQLQGEQSAYARAGGGAGESSFGTPGTGLAQLRKLTVAEYGRKARTMAI
jgi:hypothetical protein